MGKSLFLFPISFPISGSTKGGMAERKHVQLFSDGSCLGNPGPGGYGVVFVHGEHRKELSRGFRHTTNNRMELLAAIVGLESPKQPCDVTFHRA